MASGQLLLLCGQRRVARRPDALAEARAQRRRLPAEQKELP